MRPAAAAPPRPRRIETKFAALFQHWSPARSATSSRAQRDAPGLLDVPLSTFTTYVQRRWQRGRDREELRMYPRSDGLDGAEMRSAAPATIPARTPASPNAFAEACGRRRRRSGPRELVVPVVEQAACRQTRRCLVLRCERGRHHLRDVINGIGTISSPVGFIQECSRQDQPRAQDVIAALTRSMPGD